MDLQELKFQVNTDRLDAAITKIEKLGTAVKDLAKPVNELTKSSDKASKATKDIGEAADGTSKKLQGIGKATGGTVKSVEGLREKLQNTFKDLAEGMTRGESSVLNLARSLGATETELGGIKSILGDISKLVKDPFDSAIGSVRAVTKELEMMKQRANLAGEGISLTTKQLREYSRIADEIGGKFKAQGVDITQGAGLQSYNTKLRETQSVYIASAVELNKLTAAEKNHGVAINNSTAAAKANANVGDAMVAQYRKRQTAIQNEINKLKEQATALRASSSVTTGNVSFRLGNLGASASQIAEAKALRKEIEDLGKAARKSEAPLKGMASVLRQIIPALGALSAGAVVAQLGVEFVRTADFLTLFEARLGFLSKGTLEFNSAFSQLVEISNEARTSVQDTSVFFSRLVPIMQSVGRATSDAFTVTESFSKLLMVSGTSSREASSAMYQLSQALGKGKLDGDEFRTVAEAVPELLRLLEKQLGVTRAELYKMSEQGKLTADVLMNTLVAALPELEKAAAGMPKTVDGALIILRNTGTELVKSLNDATQVTQGMATIIEKLAAGMKILADNADVVVTVLGAMTGAAITAGIIKIGLGMQAAALSAGTLTGVLSGLAALVARNPVIALILGVGAAAGAISANSSIMDKSIEGVRKKIKDIQSELAAIEGDSSFVTGSSTRYTELQKELEKSRQELALFNKASYSNEEVREQRRLAGIASATKEQESIAKVRRELNGMTGDYNKFIAELAELENLSKRGLSAEETASAAAKIYERYGIGKKTGEKVRSDVSAKPAAVVKSAEQLSEEMRAEGIRAITNSEIESIFAANERNRVTAEGNAALKDQLDMLGKTEEQIYAKSRADELAIIDEKEKNLLFASNIQIAEQELKLLKEKYQLNGDIKARTDLLKKEADATAEIQKQSEQMASMFTSAFSDLISGGKSFGDVLVDLGRSIANLITEIMVLEPLKASLKSSFASSGGMSGLISAASSFLGFADGGAFSGGIQKFANGGSFTNKIVNKPTNFNIGQMGEAGPEAIMPLMRTSSGALGVQSSGGSGSNVSVVVVNNTSEKAETKETVDSKGNRRVEVMIGDMVAGEMGRSSSGIQRSMKSTFGLQPSLVRR